MSDIAIQVQGLGKRYALGGRRKPYKTIRESLVDAVTAPFRRRNTGEARAGPTSFWALKDVNFTVNRGEVVGVIGRNGAGKSTLLKVLSRITDPTEGQVEIVGRVGSLLEVGTGFHPELTGRENVYLNGAILGMRRAEITRKFDEIVAFAETEKFLDTPVKFYSSGMYTRLAFAVAAHLDPEILVVDEVLAVGDAEFQKKCLGKMQDVAGQGRTVLFVSHNISAVQSLCSRCVALQGGRVLADLPTADAVRLYMGGAGVAERVTRPASSTGVPTLVGAAIVDPLADHDESGGGPQVRLDLTINTSSTRRASVDLRLTDATFAPVGFGSLGTLDPRELVELRPGDNAVSLMIATHHLAVGRYLVSIDLTVPDVEYYDRADACLQFEVVRPPVRGAIRVVSQAWGYGSVQLDMRRCPPAA
jgi:lipopolysaccharide transport system ATP-binding protein